MKRRDAIGGAITVLAGAIAAALAAWAEGRAQGRREQRPCEEKPTLDKALACTERRWSRGRKDR